MAPLLLLVICSASALLLPRFTVPKFSEEGKSCRAAGVPVPTRLTNSSAVLLSELISTALMCCPADCGVKLTEKVQLAPGATAFRQLPLSRVKSGVLCRELICSVLVPVLLSVTCCSAVLLPIETLEKLSELCDTEKLASGLLLSGAPAATAAAVPVRVTASGLVIASLSTTSEPDILCGEGCAVPLVYW